MKRRSGHSASKEAIERMKMEIANEFDADLIEDEKQDGTTVRNLVNRAEEKISGLEDEFKKR